MVFCVSIFSAIDITCILVRSSLPVHSFSLSLFSPRLELTSLHGNDIAIGRQSRSDVLDIVGTLSGDESNVVSDNQRRNDQSHLHPMLNRQKEREDIKREKERFSVPVNVNCKPSEEK